MLTKLRRSFFDYIKENLFLYFIAILILVVGIVSGSISVKALNVQQKDNLINYINLFFQKVDINALNSKLVLKYSILNNLKLVSLIWVLGLTIIGIPFVMLILFIKGFILGFTVGFLIDELGFTGILFSTISLFPQNIIIIPSIVIIGVSALSFSLILLKNKRGTEKYSIIQQVTGYTILVSLMALIIILGCFIEAYISPVFMKMMLPYI
ncbi:MAG: stage sporulation protein [Thermosediminibacterales bacterium]|nr:stage sporulation protein [Thermosediminibacterales bacterium]